MDKPTPIVKICVSKTWHRELWSDICTFGVVAGTFGLGWWLDSSAMQWFGFVLLFVIMIGRANSQIKKFTPQEAADWLCDEYDVSPRKEPRNG